MITEAILSAFFGVSDFLLSLLPDLEWIFDSSAWSYVTDILSMIAYLLPMGHIKAIISFLISIAMFRLTVAFVRLLLSFIPFMG